MAASRTSAICTEKPEELFLQNSIAFYYVLLLLITSYCISKFLRKIPPLDNLI